MPSFFKQGFSKIISLYCFCLITQSAKSQIIPINFRHYSLADGLSSYKVVKILQDHFGLTWVATQDGLNRFDGKGMTIYNKSAKEKHLLAGNDITDIMEDTSRNMLWVISSYGGLNGINLRTGNVTHAIATGDAAGGFNHGWLKCMMMSRDELWIGTFNGITIYDPENGRFKENIVIPLKKTKGVDFDFDVDLLYKDEYGRIWVFIANYGLVVYSGDDHAPLSIQNLSNFRLPAKNTNKQFTGIQKIGQGQMLLATCLGIKKITYDGNGAIRIEDQKIAGADGKEVHAIERDRDGNLWFATGAGLFKFTLQDSSVAAIRDVNQSDQKKWLSSVNSLFFDSLDNLWLGTLQGFAIATTTHAVFLNYYQSADLKEKIDRAYFIFPINDSSEYVCAEDGFYYVDNFNGIIKRLKGGMAFFSMYRHPDGNIIVSSEHQLFVFHLPDKFLDIGNVYPELSGLKNETFNNAATLGDSLIFMGSESGNGVYEWNYRRKTISKIDTKSTSPLKSDIVNSVYKDRKNKIWILSDNSFAIYDPVNKKVENHELLNDQTGKSLNLFFDVCEASSSFWLASYGSGIVHLDGNYKIKDVISTSHGMANAGVYKIFPVGDTLLYVTSNNGLCRISIPDYSVSNYFERDGLHSNAFEESCGIIKNGKIYAGGPNGFTIINPGYFTTNRAAPRLYINRVAINTRTGLTDTFDLSLKSITIPNDVLQVTVHFSGLSYSNPEKISYMYRMVEQHNEWINLGNQNTFPLTRLSPGRYRLQLKAANENGIWSEPSELEMTFLPRWYQTWWFMAVIAIAMAGILYLLYSYRIKQLKKIIAVRTKISQDLHDEVGSSLSGIGLISKMARQELEDEKTGEAKKSLEKISVSAAEVLAMMSDIVWAINPKNDTLEKMIRRLKTYAKNTTAPHGIQLHFETDEELHQHNISMQRRKNIYLICKEGINNATHYSECKNLYFILRRDDRQFYINIRDDGKGFDLNKAIDGNGLYNMRVRAMEIKADLKIESGKERGTSIILRVKIT